MVSPEIVTEPEVILRMRKSGIPAAALRWMVRLVARMVRFLLINNSAVVKTMGRPTSKVILSPAGELAMTLRNNPGPGSTGFVTGAAQTGEDNSMGITIQGKGG